jgi:hypothetical protein
MLDKFIRVGETLLAAAGVGLIVLGVGYMFVYVLVATT